MLAGQALLDTVAVIGDVEFSACSKGFGGCDAGVVVISHLHGREVGVGAGAVPVAADRFGVQSGAHVELLAYPVEQPASDPKMIGGSGRTDGSDLELPLSGHDLAVDARDGQAGFEAGVQVGLNDRPPEDLV